MSKKIIIIILAIVLVPVLLVAGTIAAIYYNQQKIVQRALLTVNEGFDGELTIKGSHISPFANFPYISIDLEEVTFFESKAQDTRPLYTASDVYVGFDIKDVLAGNYTVKSIKVKNGHLDVVKYENGDINLLLAKGIGESSEPESEEGFDGQIELESLIIDGFEISYKDFSSAQEILAHIKSVRTNLKFSADHFFIDIASDFLLDIQENGEPTFFSNKHLDIDLHLDYDITDELVTVLESQVILEQALFSLDGFVDLDDDLNMDIKFYGEKPDFNIFAAFAPPEVGDALKRYKNEGQVYFLGSVEGKSGNGNTPAISVEFGADNAYFLNTEMDKKVDNLAFAGYFTNGKDRTLESSELRLQRFTARPEEGIFEGKMIVKNFKDPFIKVNLHADLDLEFIGQFLQVEGLERIKGQVLLDMDFDELIDLELPGENLAQLKQGIDSELTIKNLSFNIPNYPHSIRNANGHAVMREGKIEMDNLSFNIAGSDFKFTMGLSDFPALFHQYDQMVNLDLNANSSKIDFPELLSFDSALLTITDEVIDDFEIKLAFEANAKDLWNFEHLPKGEFFIKDFHAKLKNYSHELHDFHADLIISDSSFLLKDFSGFIDKSDFHFTGQLDNYKKWFQEVKRGDTKLEFDFHSEYLQLADLLSYDGQNYLPEDYRNEELRGVKAHGLLDLHYDSIFHSLDFYLSGFQGKMNVHPLKFEGFKGRVHYEDEHLLVEGFEGKMGASDFKVDLAYYLGEDSTIRKRDNHFKFMAKALDLDALMNYDIQADTSHEDAFNIFDLPFTDMKFQAEIGKLNYHTYWLENFKLEGRIQEDHYMFVDTLGVNVAEGSLGLKGYFNGSDPKNIYFNSAVTANKLDLDKLLIKFENFGQDYFINENIHGKVSGTITSNFLVHPDFTPILEQSEAHMDLRIYDGSINNFAPLHALSDYFKDKNLNMVRFDTLENSMDLKEGVLSIPKMNINSSLGFIELSGRQSLDLSMDYFLRIPLGLVTQVGFRSLFGGKNKGEVDPDQVDDIVYRNEDRRVRFLNINMKGTPDDIQVSLGKDRKN
ncbi:AsmA-like C-terminal region-containing protein [Litoribacter populi]|uniref:AsmA-like C-terminal region-containing protein n=1 Tax=Litoribacter populi TaxID=2598460 RepID=UPI0011806C8D|nr:AsmA-like C-terminal region-containing protein [Litoribacter populi]